MSTIPEVIGKGAYGCIHKPSLHCENPSDIQKNDYTDKVSKILETKYADDELDSYKILKEVDNIDNYYLGLPVKCKPANTPENETAIKKCEGDDLWEKFKELSLLVMEDGGVNLEKYTDKIKKRETAEILILEFHRVIHGIALFFRAGIVHFDMKPQNIVFSEKTLNMKIIDFGLTMKLHPLIEKSFSSKNGYAMYHWSYPFEFYFLNKNSYNEFCGSSATYKEQYFNNLLENILDPNNQTKTIIAFRYFYSYYLENKNDSELLKNHFHGFRDTMLRMNSSTYTEFVEKSLNSVDVYGLGLTLLYVLHNIQKLISPDLYNALIKLANSAVTTDVFKRITISDFLNSYEKIVTENGLMKTYKKTFTQNYMVKKSANDKEKSVKSKSAKSIQKYITSSKKNKTTKSVNNSNSAK